MDELGKCFDRKVVYFDFQKESISQLHQLRNWYCFAISNKNYLEQDVQDFIKWALLNEMLMFHSQGQFSEKLHLQCDLAMVSLEVDEDYEFFDVVTAGSNDEDLADAFWGCVYAPALPPRADYDDLTILCVSIDGQDYRDDLKRLMLLFDTGWVPDDA